MSGAKSAGPAIRVRDLGKFYKIYPQPSALFWELLRRKPMHVEKHVLSDISFDVARGEVVGIIGPNGAGKSTLLSIIAGTLQQSFGEVQVDGKLTAILELGTGFDPEHTGRQNVFLGGISMGMTRREVEDKIDDIVAFSELEDVIDQPFKTYSSGMQARLTFSTAISVDPDILIIDEALAAGDAAFVQKCLRRVERIVTSGSTVLLVSHSSTVITRFASRAIWLDKGRIVELGDAETVCKHYEIDTFNRVTAAENAEAGQALKSNGSEGPAGRQPPVAVVGEALVDFVDPDAVSSGEGGVEELPGSAVADTAPTQTLGDHLGHVLGDQQIRVVGVEIEGRELSPDVFAMGSELTVHIDVESQITNDNPSFYVAIQRTDDELMVWTATSHHHLGDSYRMVSSAIAICPGRSRISMRLPNFGLNRGSYFVNIGIEPRPYTQPVADYHDYKPRIKHFSIVGTQENQELTKVFLSPSVWQATGAAEITRHAEAIDDLDAVAEPLEQDSP